MKLPGAVVLLAGVGNGIQGVVELVSRSVACWFAPLISVLLVTLAAAEVDQASSPAEDIPLVLGDRLESCHASCRP